MSSVTPKREGTIEGRAIRVYDGLVEPEVTKRIASALEANSFTKTEVAKPETSQHKHWVREITTESTQKLPLYPATMEAARSFCTEGESYRMYRSYCNFASYGDVLFIHTDCQPGARELTALWFIADEWHPEWGGETLFYNSDMDAEFVVSPRPGRLVLFDGAIPHAGRPPTRICFAPRYTYAMKFELVQGGA